MSDFNPCGVLTLMTDFGNRDPFVGITKGVILQRFHEAKIVDLTHDAAIYKPFEAGFWIERCYRYFPSGTVHLVVIDPGVGTARPSLVVVVDGHAFVAPDNGTLSSLIEQSGGKVIRIQTEKLGPLRLDPPSSTFHARDLFAPIVAELACGRIAPNELGSPTHYYVPSEVAPLKREGNRIHGVVVAMDHFGNLITNIEESDLQHLQEPIVHAGDQEVPLLRTYGDVRPGTCLALVNSFGVVEIARREKSAAETLGLGLGAPVTVSEARSCGE